MVMVPIYAISSLISLFSVEAAFVIDAIRDIYEVCPFTFQTTPRTADARQFGLMAAAFGSRGYTRRGACGHELSAQPGPSQTLCLIPMVIELD